MEALQVRDNYGVELIHTDEGEIVDVPVPGGGQIRRFIEMRAEIANADAVISVAKIKFGYDDLRLSLERASARETAMRVAAGGACRQLGTTTYHYFLLLSLLY